jgi:hypothetical protein
MNRTLAHDLAESHVADLSREAERARLAEIARRARPSRGTVPPRRRSPFHGLLRSPGRASAAGGSPA